MLKKIAIALLALGTCAVAQDAHTLNVLDGNARVLMVFAPDANSASFKLQMQMIEHHSFELSSRNTVVVPVSEGSLVPNYFEGETLPLTDRSEQTYARTRYHVRAADFVVLLLNESGAEQMRSVQPVDIYQLVARLDKMPTR